VKSYTVSLTVNNGKGCTNVFKDTVTILPGPEAIAEGKDKDGDTKYCLSLNDSTSKDITVLPKPIAGFTATPDDMSIDQPTVQFLDHSTDGTMWDWDFGDHKTNITRNPFHTYADTGTFIVTEIVINTFGCNDTATARIRVNAQPALFIPNAFSPDGDNQNDTFIPVGNGITDFSMLVFDRWGKKIFETTDFNSGWNGKVSGSDELAKEDIYTYKISAKDVLQKVRHYTGSVMLITQ
jgi:gliding motility-associated-like protein